MLRSHLVYERLTTLKVADVMTKVVVTVEPEENLDEVAQRFVQRHLSSAPVIDAKGQCVGILSAADFVRRQITPARQNEATHNGHCSLVRDEMTPAVRAVRAEQSLLSAARVMCAQHIHHLPVIDDQLRPIGVVSTMDIVAAMVNAVDETETSG